MPNLSKSTRIALVLLICFLILTMFLTYAVRSNYMANLPLVQIVTPEKNNLKQAYEAIGTVHIDKANLTKYIAGFNLNVNMVYAGTGDYIEAGKPILSFDMQSLLIAEVTLNQEIIALYYDAENQNENSVSSVLSMDNIINDAASVRDLTESERNALAEYFKLQEYKLNAASLQNQLSSIQKLISSDGILYADVNCEIVQIIDPFTLTVYRGDLYAATIPFPSKTMIEFTVDSSKKSLSVGNNVTVGLRKITADEKGNTVFEYSDTDLMISSKSFNGDSSTYTCYVDDSSVWMHDKEQTSVDILYVSGEYSTVVPIGAVEFIEDSNSGYVYMVDEKQKAFGKVFVVSRQIVLITDYDEERAVVNIPPKSQIAFPCYNLKDDTAVRLW